MNKILLVLQREYLTRVRKRTFLLMTFLTPIFFAALFIVPILLTSGLETTKVVEVIDESAKIKDKLKGDKNLVFVASKYKNVQEAKDNLIKNKHYAILYIPQLDLDKPAGFKLFAEKSIAVEVEFDITEKVEKAIEDMKLQNSGIDKKTLESMKTDVSLITETLKGEDSSSMAAYIVGFTTAFIIYMSVFLYGAQVMRGVVEEKTNRIIEVIISSVKPFQLMMGKILGIALIGLTQFLIWIVLTFGMVAATSSFLDLDKYSEKQLEQSVATKNAQKKDRGADEIMGKIFSDLSTINIPLVIATFLFYFLGGYLLYSAMFAAAASAVDNETEMQQFTLPISLPLILAIICVQPIIRNPDGALSFWMSVIPFTSPIIMMIRIPFGVPVWELATSMILLVIGFVFMTWLAARIYRIGILMYGKKVTFKELGKWALYKQ